MQLFNVTIKFIAPYLQARFSEESQKELLRTTKRTVLKSTSEPNWEKLAYRDQKGFYIPALQLEGCLANAGRDIKAKSRRTNIKQWVKANLFVKPDKIYLNKKNPDFINTSYPPRKDGSRVRIDHPAFREGLEVSFQIECLDDDVEESQVREILEQVGRIDGLGAWRPKHWRFTIIDFKKV